MVQALASDGIECLPLPPVNPMPYRQRLAAVREFSTGTERLRDAGGRVTSFKLGPRWLMPPMVLATSPEAIRDILSTKDDSVDKTTPVFDQVRRVIGASLTDLPFEQWKPRRRTLQPVFTKQRVSEFGGHMEQAAQSVSESWHEDALIDLDAECRTITLRALGRSVLGLDLEQRADEVVEPLRIALAYAVRRATRPLRAPRWLPTPARHRARAASAKLHALTREILRDCRADPTRVAPLVHALLAAEDPETGKRLSDDEICDELVMFLFAGHDTTTTALTYALWSLGHHTDCQNRVAAEVAALPDRPLTSDDIPQLGYTVQVIRESLRLCPRRLRGHAWHPATSKSAATGCPRARCSSWGEWPYNATRSFGTTRFDSTRNDSARRTSRLSIGGNTCPSAAAPARASATISPCSKSHSPWRHSSGESKFAHSTTNFRSRCTSP